MAERTLTCSTYSWPVQFHTPHLAGEPPPVRSRLQKQWRCPAEGSPQSPRCKVRSRRRYAPPPPAKSIILISFAVHLDQTELSQAERPDWLAGGPGMLQGHSSATWRGRRALPNTGFHAPNSTRRLYSDPPQEGVEQKQPSTCKSCFQRLSALKPASGTKRRGP